MRILQARVEECVGSPRLRHLVVLVDALPACDELRHAAFDLGRPRPWRSPATLYVAVHPDGYVSRWLDDGTGDGLDSRPVILTMADGTHRTVVGPWTSSNAVAAEHVAEVHPAEITMHTNPELFAGHGNGFLATLTRAAVSHALDLAGATDCGEGLAQ